MKTLKKVITYSAIVLMLVPYVGSAEPTSTPKKVVTVKPKEGQVEMVEERTATTKTFLQSDGSKQLVVSQSPIHFEKEESGVKSFYDIDPTLQEKKIAGFIGTGEYENKSNEFSLNISKNLGSKAFSIEKNGVKIEEFLTNISSTENNSNVGFETKQSKIETEQKDNKVTYKNVSKDTDLLVYSMPDGVKEYLVLNNYNGQNLFEFELKMNNVHFEKKEDGSYKFYKDKTNEEVFTIPRFLMWDSKGGKDHIDNEYSYEVKTELTKENNKYIFKVIADNSWLSSKDRVFPIYLDPAFSTYSYEDTYVQSGYPWTRAWDQRALYLGRGDTKGHNQALVDFSIPDLSGARVTYSQFDVYQYGNCGGSCTWSNVSAYTVGGYNPWDVYWYNRPGYVWWVGAGRQTAAWGWFGSDVTRAVQHWVQEGNYTGSKVGSLGFNQDDSSNWGFRTWVSRNNPDYGYWGQPKLTINYIDYNAVYYPTDVPNMIAGTTVDVPVTVVNTGRNWWYNDQIKLSYHIVNNSTGATVWDGEFTSLPYHVSPKGGQATVTAKVKVPTISGNYTIKWDLIYPGVTWFSDQQVATSNKTINVTPPSFSSMTHLGTEDYYTKAGPIDLATGNLSFTANDMALNSNAGGLSVDRSYNSNSLDQTFNHDANGYIRTWLFNGPYKENDQAWRLAREYIRGEANLKPSEGSTSNGNVWKSATEPNTGQMWLNWVFFSQGNYQVDWASNVTAYGAVYVYSPSTRTVQLKMGSDDGLKTWLNGNLVLFNDTYRGLTLDSDSATVTLKEGWNTLITKTSQGGGGWQMSARFLSTTGQIMNDLKYSLNNPEVFNIPSVLGKNWSANFDQRLFTSDPENIYYKDGTGTVNIYTRNADGSYNKPAGSYSNLVKNTDGSYKFTSKDGTATIFGSDGKINKIVDSSENTISYQYINNLLAKITDNNRSINLEYNADNKLVKVSNNIGQYYAYGYDQNQKLAAVTDQTGAKNVYTYNSEGKLESSQNKKGAITRINYTNGKVTTIVDALNSVTSVLYSKMRTEVTDPLGRKTIYNFDQANLLSSTTNAKGYSEKYLYDGKYNLTKIFPDLTTNNIYYYSVNYSYDANDNLVSTIYPDGTSTSSQFSGNDLVVYKDQKGQSTTFSYSTDGKRLLLSKTDPLNKITRFSYDLLGRLTTITDPNNQVTKYQYNSDGDLVQTISPKGEISTTEYNEIGLPVKVISSLGKSSCSEYDELNRVVNLRSPIGEEVKYQYDSNSNLIKEIKPNGTYKTYDYDILDRLVKLTDEAGAITQFEYDKVGNKTKLINAKGKITTFAYDELNMPINQTDPEGNKIAITYNRNGSVETTTDQNGNITTNSYDKNGAVTSIKTADGLSSISYDANHNVISSTGSLNVNKLLYQNDFSQNRQDSLQPLSGKWAVRNGEYAQDESNVADYVKSSIKNLTFSDGVIEFDVKRTSSANPYFRFIYRGRGNDNYYIGFIGGVWRIGNYVNGVEEFHQVPGSMNQNQNYRIKLEANGENTKLYVNGVKVAEYIFTKRLKEGQVQLWTYLTAATFDNLSISSSSDMVKIYYDSVNRPTQVASNTNGISTDVVDATGNITQSTTSTNTVTYSYDANGQVTSVTNAQNGGTVLSSGHITRDSEGKIISLVKQNGDLTSYTYDDDGRITSTVTKNKNNEILGSYAYVYNQNSNITSATNNLTGEVKNYTYDERDQMVSDENGTYTYDITGNRMSFVGNNGTTIYSYDETGSGDKLVNYSFTANDAVNNYTASLSYDKNGNVTSRTNSKTGQTKYEYDTSSRLKKAILSDGTTVEYVYDAISGKRVQRIETMSTGKKSYINFIYDDDKLVSESDINGNLIRSYTWDENESLISISIYSSEGTQKTYQYIKDAHGNVVGLSDENGVKVVNYEYDSWGNVIKSEVLSDTVPADLNKQNPRLYSSYWYDSALNQYFMKIRMYDSETGRFFSKDVTNNGYTALDLNLYLYTNNNPINYVDPSGRWQLALVGAGGATAGVLGGIGAGITAPAWLVPVAIGIGVIAVGYGISKVVNNSKAQSKPQSKPNTSTNSNSSPSPNQPNNQNNNSGKKIVETIKKTVSGVKYTASKVVQPIIRILAPSAPVLSDKIDDGYDTFNKLKNAIGPAGDGFQWHHIVEQSQIIRSGFDPRVINSVNNIVRVSTQVHQKISGYYNSIPAQGFTNGMTVRNWLAGQSFEFQQQFGNNVYNMFNM